jgi:hypothetical protein
VASSSLDLAACRVIVERRRRAQTSLEGAGNGGSHEACTQLLEGAIVPTRKRGHDSVTGQGYLVVGGLAIPNLPDSRRGGLPTRRARAPEAVIVVTASPCECANNPPDRDPPEMRMTTNGCTGFGYTAPILVLGLGSTPSGDDGLGPILLDGAREAIPLCRGLRGVREWRNEGFRSPWARRRATSNRSPGRTCHWIQTGDSLGTRGSRGPTLCHR